YDISTTEKLGTYTSAEMREKWHDSDKDNGLSNYIHNQTQDYGGDINILNTKAYFLNDPDTNLIVTYTCHIRNDKPVNEYYMHTDYMPFFKQNPFKSAKRLLPIEFPYNMDYNCIVTMKLPQNFAVDEALQPVEIDYQDKDMVYKKLFGYDSSMHLLSLNTHFTTKETVYLVENYETLRQFFDEMIRKENEIVVVKKDKE
ncbi:MAG TPA: hypothetical protein VHA52_01995, partial [Candidatus Babeliaceae bacterium]|nr:hypothetical protein [Candidatus Babeliaceae bacterium]